MGIMVTIENWKRINKGNEYNVQKIISYVLKLTSSRKPSQTVMKNSPIRSFEDETIVEIDHSL